MAESGNGPPRGGHLLPIGRAEQYRAAGANIAMIERELMTADAEQQAERFAEQLFELTNTYLSEADRRLVRKAFDFARREHGDQRRKTGELFINHPVTVATYLASYRLDATAVAAALLHDVAEDIPIPIEQLAVEFGPEIAALVDGVTKLKEVTRGVAQGRRLSSEEIQQATLQKLFAAMTSDVRTVIIKLFDRLHNMRTIDAMSPAKQRAKAKETLSVYAPLAYRLGMWQVKGELEARSLAVLEPHAYETIRAELERLHRHQEPRFATVRAQIEAKLRAAGLPDLRAHLLGQAQLAALDPSLGDRWVISSQHLGAWTLNEDFDEPARATLERLGRVTGYQLYLVKPLNNDEIAQVAGWALFQQISAYRQADKAALGLQAMVGLPNVSESPAPPPVGEGSRVWSQVLQRGDSDPIAITEISFHVGRYVATVQLQSPPLAEGVDQAQTLSANLTLATQLAQALAGNLTE